MPTELAIKANGLYSILYSVWIAKLLQIRSNKRLAGFSVGKYRG